MSFKKLGRRRVAQNCMLHITPRTRYGDDAGYNGTHARWEAVDGSSVLSPPSAFTAVEGRKPTSSSGTPLTASSSPGAVPSPVREVEPGGAATRRTGR